MDNQSIKRKGYSKSLNKEELWEIYKSMKTQRLLEERLLKLYKGGQLSGAVYPGIGPVSYTHLTLPTKRIV